MPFRGLISSLSYNYPQKSVLIDYLIGFIDTFSPVICPSKVKKFQVMRPRVEWMTQADERILEFLADKEIVASPSVIAVNIDYTKEYISRRCNKLEDAGLIQRVEARNFRITNLGRGYLDGTLDTDRLDDPD